MSDKKGELPRDLRGLCGGTAEDADGSHRILLFPVRAYANVCEVRTKLEWELVNPDTHIDDTASLREQLEFVKKEQAEMERRILDHFEPRHPNNKGPFPDTVDHGAKRKVMKAMADAKAGNYDRSSNSKTLKAVLRAVEYSRKHGRMPSHAELKSCGFNDQQATDAGKWLAMQNDPHPDPLFLPLDEPKQGRPPKK
ncbi:MAG: hypothetical protein V4689_15235 [Verrucomicrobiota bacterium]